MLNVLSLVTFKVFPPQMGGQKGVALFYKYLKLHANIIIAASKNNNTNEFEVREILFQNKLIFLNIFKISKLKKLVRKNHIDVIIVEHSYPAWIAYLLSKQTGIPFIIHSHNIEAYRFKQMNKWWWKLYLKYESWIHKKAHHNFFISEEDRQFAINNFEIEKERTIVIPYGCEVKSTLSEDKKTLKIQLGLPLNKNILLFNGTLNYKPNVDAINFLLFHIEPILKSIIDDFKIVICGKNIDENLKQIFNNNEHFIYKGFVEEIEPYYAVSDVFLNPITNNSGVKTKVIEAIFNNCTVISFYSGATGIPLSVCKEKLIVVDDEDYENFSKAIVQTINIKVKTPQVFFEYFDWNNIVQNAFYKLKIVTTNK